MLEIKKTPTEVFDGLITRLDMAKKKNVRVSELVDMTRNISQTEKRKKTKKKEQNI